ncbi:hypothetical protein [Pseudescherichia sp.]|uniref:hypothetical protein n=1 Tax=Pseudescherichia sp. TaxID=2055881 RepID=UPI0028977734|nr:hypothetical protein [Pseudescherichia sp.]
MKVWLSGLALLLASTTVSAGNYRIAQSPSQKLDVWIDNVNDKSPQSWCSARLPLRIVASGDKTPSILTTFMPRLGALLESQCSTIGQVNWQMVDPEGELLAEGIAAKESEWAVVVTPRAAQPATNAVQVQQPSPAADRTPWLEFTLQDGCHLRTFWQGDASASALFIPAKANGKCERGGWLNGRSEVIQHGAQGEKRSVMTFVHGFPVSGLNDKANADSLLITSVNNERMVVSNSQAPQSWMILPYDPQLNGWKNSGMVAVEVSRDQALDDARLQSRLNEVRKVWSSWLEPGTSLTLLLIDNLHPQLRDPAAGAWRTQK